VAFEFRLPDIGEGLTEAEVVSWFVEPGGEVELDQPLVQIETDKAVTDIPAPRAGVLLHQGAAAGSVVKVGEVLAVIGGREERWEEVTSQAERAGRGEAAPIVGSLHEAVDHPGEARALPLVRKLAADLGVDLSTLRGTGPDGRVTREDVEAASGRSAGPEERIRLSKLRRTVAENMARSWREIPHVTTFGEADASALLAARRVLGERRGRPVPWEALFIQAVLPALQGHPEFNASLQGEDLVLKRHYDVGFAVDTQDGLVVAVVRGAHQRDVFGLADEVERLAGAVRDRKAAVEELTGQTFTISNIGAVGGGLGTPIIPYGTTAILSFGRIEDRPVARDGRVQIAPILPLSLSYDHRVIDGALGRRFMAAVVERLEGSTRFVQPA
jgi:pyruvate dehydrogenase E2 component (dihydrolipoamide acetyltransferase)